MEKILLVDDEQDILENRSDIISTLGYKCFTALNKQEAVKLLRKKEPDILLTDMKMPDHDGFELLRITKEIDPCLPVIMITGYGTVESAVKAIKLGAYDYLQKPISPKSLDAIIKEAANYRLAYRNYSCNTSDSNSSFDSNKIIGRSESLQEVMKRACKIARSDANVMI